MKENFEKKLDIIKEYFGNFTVVDSILISKKELLCAGAMLNYNVVPGIKPIDNMDKKAVDQSLSSLKRKKLYFTPFSGPSYFNENFEKLVTTICSDGNKCEIVFPDKGGRKNIFFISVGKDNMSVIVNEHSDKKVIVYLCENLLPIEDIINFGNISVESIRKIKYKMDTSFDKNEILQQISEFYSKQEAKQAIYNFMIRKNNCGLFCKYNWKKNNFYQLYSGVFASSEYGSGVFNF